MRLGSQEGAASAGWLAFFDISNINSQTFAVTEVLLDLMRQVADGDQDVFNAMVAQESDTILKQRFAIDGNERFRDFVSKGAHFDTLAAGENDCLVSFDV